MLLLSNFTMFHGSIWKGFQYPGPALAGTEARCLFDSAKCCRHVSYSTWSDGTHHIYSMFAWCEILCNSTEKTASFRVWWIFPVRKTVAAMSVCAFLSYCWGSEGWQLLIPAICEFGTEILSKIDVFLDIPSKNQRQSRNDDGNGFKVLPSIFGSCGSIPTASLFDRIGGCGAGYTMFAIHCSSRNLCFPQ